MPNNIDIYTPRHLAEVVRQTPPTFTFFKDTFFTRKKTFATKRVDIDIVKGGRKMAAFVHPMVGGTAMKKEGYRTESYAPPLINPYSVTTADQLMNRLPGEDIYSGKTPAQRAAEKLQEEYAMLNDATTRREEWMAAKALLEGQVHVKGEGVDDIIDFGFTNKKTLTSTARWGQSGAKILKNLQDWEREVRINGFTNVDMVIMGTAAVDAFLNDADIAAKLDNRRTEMGLIHPKDLPGGVCYIGHLNKPNVDIYEYSEVYQDDWTNPLQPETKPLMPDNQIIMISSQANFVMAYGLCTYIEDNGQWVTAQSDRVLRSYIAHHPDRKEIELQTHPLPIPDKADSWLVATVC